MATRWLLLATFYFDSRTTRISKRAVTHPSYTYEARLLSAGYLDRSIPVPSGLYQGSDAVIEIAETDRALRQFLSIETPLRRLFELRLMPEGGSEAAYSTFGTMEVLDAEFLPGKCIITGRDITWSWIEKPIPGLGNRTNFPWMIEGVDEFFFPILQGILESPSGVSPLGKQGVVQLPYMGPTMAGSPPVAVDRWALAQTPIVGVTVYRKRVDEGRYTEVASGWTINEEPYTINGISYTLSFLDFLSPQDAGTQIRVDAEGIYTRGGFFGMPGVSTPGTPIRNPVDFFINMMYAIVSNEPRQPRWNITSLTAVRTALDTAATTASPDGPYLCDGAITEPLTAREFLGRFLTSFELDLFTNRSGEMTLAFTDGTNPSRPVFSQGPIFGDPTDTSLILMNSTRFRVANPHCNRLRYNWARNYATGEWGEKSVFDNTTDQALLGGSFSPPIPEVVEDTLQLWFVRDEDTADDVVRRRMAYLGLGSYRVELQAPLPEVVANIELAEMFGVTSFWGLAPGGMHNAEFKTTGLTYDLGRLICTVRGVLREPVTLAEQGVFYGGGFWAVSQGMSGADETFIRSSFYYNTNDYNNVTRHLFGGIVSSNDPTVWHTCFILDEDDNIVGRLTVPPNVTGADRQWLTPVEWFPLSGGHIYRCRMGNFSFNGTGAPNIGAATWAPLILDPERDPSVRTTNVRLTYELGGNLEEGPGNPADGGDYEDGTGFLERAFDDSASTSWQTDESQDRPERWNPFVRNNSVWANKVTNIRYETVHGWGGLGFALPTSVSYIALQDGSQPAVITVEDNFNRPDQNHLGTASGGFTWTQTEGSLVTSRIDIGHTAFGGFHNIAVVIGNGTTWATYRAETDLSSTDHYAEIEMQSTNVNNQQGVCVRFDSSSATFYCLSTNRAAGQLQLRKFVTGVITSIDTFDVSGTLLTDGTPQTLGLEVEGSTLRAYLAGSLVGTATDGSLTTGVRTGVFGFSTTLAAVQGQFDNFSASTTLPSGVGSVFSVVHTSTSTEDTREHYITQNLHSTMPDATTFTAAIYRHAAASNIKAKAYKAQVHVLLSGLVSGDEYEQPYTICRTWQPTASGVMMNRRQAIDLTDVVEAYFRAWGRRTASGGHTFYLYDAGTSNSGTSGARIDASEIEFTSTARSLQASGNILPYLSHGNRYGVEYVTSGGEGEITGCGMLVLVRRVGAGAFSVGQPAAPGNPGGGGGGSGTSGGGSGGSGSGGSGAGAPVGGEEDYEGVGAGTEYFASPTGGGTGLTALSPFLISDFWGVAQPGDSLTLLDGTYTGADSMIAPPSGLNGLSASDQRISIRALNDGMVIIDGENARVPVSLDNNDYLSFRGFNARRSNAGTVQVFNSSNIKFYRVVARDAGSGNHMVWDVAGSDNCYFQECVGFGRARKILQFFQSDNNLTTRCFWMFNTCTHSFFPLETPMESFSLSYNSFNNKSVDDVFTVDADSGSGTTGAVLYGAASSNWAPDVDDRCNMEFHGAAIFVTASQNPSIDTGSGLLAGLFSGQSLNNVTIRHAAIYIGHSGVKTSWLVDYTGTDGAQNQLAHNLTDVGGDGPDHGAGWNTSNNESAATVGGVSNVWDGGGSSGARIGKRRDSTGAATATGRWPFEMNQRLIDELTAAGRTSLDVTATLESIWGTIPPACRWD